ncbi:unnamed protein product [Acanthoscelides obtectus]|uniref:TFIIS N-terminal domain-containing protein n=1 Tax=Acanthoscelides obtectus TaxID=200917 RepID=A0A9P0P2U6_ACAOB|nr:unnamed protein product [Acanthoscelides obtectus]CAK1660348.1 Transcription elongation factor B polypeptide 3 [Acanthoscelides obtectus]
MENDQDKIMKVICYYQERLEKYATSGSGEKLLYTLGELKKLPIKTTHLENTGVGRTVNGLKKLGGDVGEAAKNLVTLWKEMVMQEEQAEKEAQSNGADSVGSSYSSESESNKLKIVEPPIAAPVEKEVKEHSESDTYHKRHSHKSNKENDRSSSTEKSHTSKEKQGNEKTNRGSNKEEKSSHHSKTNGEKTDKRREKHSSSSYSKSSNSSERDKNESSRKSKEKDKSKHKSSRHEDERKHKKRDPTPSSESESESDTESDTSSESSSESESDHETSKHSKSDRRRSSDREGHSKRKRHDSSSSSEKEKHISRSKEKSDKHKNEDEKHSKKRHRSESSDEKDSKKKSKSSEKVSSRSTEMSSKRKDECDEKHSKKKRHSSGSSDDETTKKKEKRKSSESSKSKEKSAGKRKNSDENKNSKRKRTHSSDGSDEEKVEKKLEKPSRKRDDSNNRHSAKKRTHSSDGSGDEKIEKKSKTVESRDSKSKDRSSKSSKQDEDKHRHKDKGCDKDKKKEKSKEDSKARSEKDSSSTKSHSSSSSKDKDANKHKDDKKSSTSSKSKSKSEPKTDKDSSKMKIPKASDMKKIANGIDSGSGASFAEALGLCGPPIGMKGSSSKKKSLEKAGKAKEQGGSSKPTKRESSEEREPPPMEKDFDETDEDENVPALLKQPELEPLNINMSSLLPEITPNYKPLGLPVDIQQKRFERMTDDEALSRVMTNKNYRTKVYSGNKMFGKVDSLFDLCVRILQDNIDALEYTGGVPYSILKPVLEKATPDQLFNMEHHNPYLIEETDELWQLHCQKEFRTKKREELESWREMYMRCLDEREARLNAITANIKQAQDKSIPVRTTKLAYVDSVVKPPRNIARKQVKNGIIPEKKLVTPADRLAQLAKSGEAAKVAVPNPGARAAERSNSSTSSAALKPKKAPLMAKTLSFMKNRFKR